MSGIVIQGADSVTGRKVSILVSQKGLHTHVASSGGIGPNVDREALAIGTGQDFFSWVPGFGPKSIRIRLRDGTSGDLVNLVFDVPGALAAANPIATAWIADAGSKTTNRMHRVLSNINTPGDEGWTDYDFTEPLENIYFKGVGALGAGTILEIEGN